VVIHASEMHGATFREAAEEGFLAIMPFAGSESLIALRPKMLGKGNGVCGFN